MSPVRCALAFLALIALGQEVGALQMAPLPTTFGPRLSAAPLMNGAKDLKTDGAAVVKGGEMCYKLDELTSEEASEPFRSVALEKFKTGTWYACTGPADDMELTCFIAPKWMGLPEGQWVCSDVPLDKATGKDAGDDGY